MELPQKRRNRLIDKAFGNPTCCIASCDRSEELYKWFLTVTRVTSPARTKQNLL